MSEKENIDDLCDELAVSICGTLEPNSIKFFLDMLEERIKKLLIEEGEIVNPKDVNEMKTEKLTVKDLGNGFYELADCVVSDDSSSSDYNSEEELYIPPVPTPNNNNNNNNIEIK